MNSICQPIGVIFVGIAATLITANALADASNPPVSNQTSQVSSPQPTINNTPVNLLAATTTDVQEKADGQEFGHKNPFFSASKLKLTLRNHAETLQLDGLATRNIWLQGARLGFESGYSGGDVGFGFDASIYASLKLAGGNDVHNLAHAGPNGASRDTKAWAYLGEYALKAKNKDIEVKYGLLASISNPYLDPYDNRLHPPTFRGLSIIATPSEKLTLKAGGVNAVFARGTDFFQRLSTATSGTPFDRHTFMGVEWDNKDDRRFVFYGSRAEDLWDQYYLSASKAYGDLSKLKLIAKTDLYYTKEQGAKLLGNINNKSYSASVTALHRGSLLTLAYQHIASDQYFDYTKETGGMYLDNSMGIDYNAPHEKSVQLKYKYDGKMDGYPGFQFTLWGVRGFGADGSVEAARHTQLSDPLNSLYWQNGKPIGGNHHEVGMRITYIMQQGGLKNMRTSLFAMKHKMDKSYPSLDFVDVRLTVEIPINVF